MVVDEFGQIAGIITTKDVLEELVDDISDEGQSSEDPIIRRDGGTYLIDGLLPFVDLQEALKLPSADTIQATHDFETVAGFVIALVGRMPVVGDTVEWGHFRFEVLDLERHRIDKLLLLPPTMDAGAQTKVF